jgi:arabinofuranosyltransferase
MRVVAGMVSSEPERSATPASGETTFRSRFPSRLRPKLLAVALVGGWGVVIFNFVAHANSPMYPTDDGYIAFSYARTLADHGALALTPTAPHVQGYSDVLWVVLLATLHLIGLSIPTAARLVATACVIALVPSTYVLARRLSPDASRLFAGMAAAVVGVLPGGIFFALSGLETSLAALLLTMAIADLIRPDLEARPPFLAMVALLGFCWLRPEGIVLWLALTVARFGALRPARLEGSKRLLGYWFGVFLGPLVLYEIFEVLYFGALVPNTIVAKLGSPTYDTIVSAFHYLGAFLGPLMAFVVLAACGIVRRRSVAVVSMAVLALFVLAVGSAVQDGYPYQRYIFVGVPALLALSASGAARIASRLRGLGPTLVWSATVGAVAVFGLGLQQQFANSPLISSAQLTGVNAIASTWAGVFASDPGPHDTTYPGYHALSRWLGAHARPGQSVALEEIGIVSYYSGLRILDTFGLANKVIAHDPGRPGYKADPAYVFRRRPDYFVMPLAPGVGSLVLALPGDQRYAKTPTFAFGYDLVGTFPARQLFDSIFARQSGLLSVSSLDDQLSDPRRIEAPPSFGTNADVARPDPEVVTEARYWLRGGAIGTIGLPQDGSLVTRFSLSVPAAGTSRLVVGSGPVANANGATWTVRASGPTGATPVQTSVTMSTGATWQPVDMSVPLSAWRGRRVQVTLTFSEPSGPPVGSTPTFVEPRVVTNAR